MVGRIREIVFDEGVDVDGIATQAASQDYVDDKFHPNLVCYEGGIWLDNTSGLPTLTPWRSGVIAWDTLNKCMAVSTSYENSWIQVGEETQDDGVNKTASTLTNGTVVYIDGAIGNKPKLYRANANDPSKAQRTIGLVTADAGILVNEEGPYTTSGVVRNLNTSAYTDGDLLWLSTTDGEFTATKPTNQYRSIMIGIVVKAHNTLGEIYVNIRDLTDELALAGFHIVDPHGWTEYDNTYMTRGWVGTTFTLTQVGSSTPYYFKGQLKQLLGNKSITVNPTPGPHWLALNCATEELEDFTSFPVAQALSTHIITEFYYGSGVVILYNANERHTTKFPKRVWAYNHYYLSTQYRSGITPSMTSIDGNGSSIDHARFSTTAGIVSDEDIDIDIAALTSSATKTIWYYRPDLTIWVSYSETNGTGVVPFGGTGRASYNSYSTGAGLVECTNNYHVLTHLFAANNGTVIAIMGNNQYLLLSDARLAASTEIATLLTQGLPFPEFRAIATFINQTSNTYSNAVKSKIVSVDTGVSYIDWRKTALNPVAGQNAASHNNLTSLQGGSAGEYFHLTNADYLNIINKIFPGGAASDTGAKLIFPTKSGLAGITPTAGNAVYDSAAKKLYVGDGSVMKVVGGGLIVTPITVSGTTPSIATLENGKHYVVDMSTATGDVTVTAPTGASEANWKVTAARNWNNAYRLSIAAAGSDKFYYAGDSTTITVIRIYNPDGWVEGCYLTTNLWVLNTDENAGSGASGSGQGRKNYIQNPSAAVSETTNWTAVNFTVTRDTSTAIPRETTTGTAFKLVSSGTSADATFISAPRLLDDVDLSRKLAIELAINVLVASGWTVDIENSTDGTLPGSWTRIPLSTDSSGKTVLPVTFGMFKSSVDMNSARPYVRFVITCPAAVNTVARTAYFSDILLTSDGSTVNSAVVEELGTYSPNFTNLGAGSVTTNYCSISRVGSRLKVVYRGTKVTAGSGAAVVNFSLPTGLTVDSTYAGGRVIGSGNFYNTTSNYSVAVYANGGASTLTFTLTTPSTDLIGSDFVNNAVLLFTAEVLVNEWAGSGTVNVAGNDVEYSSNSNSTNTASDTSSFAYGPMGSLIPNGAVGTGYTRIVQWQSPIQSGDSIVVEVDRGTNGQAWYQVSTLYPPISQGANEYGIILYNSSATQSTVVFRKGGVLCNNSTYAGNSTSAWADLVSFRWRVRKVSASSVAGFEIVKENSAGLMPASNTNLDNATATRLGLKEYKHGTAYNGGNSPTITVGSGGALSSVTFSSFIPYQMQDGTWRLRFNFYVLVTAGSRAQQNFVIAGCKPSNYQNITATDTNISMWGYAQTSGSNGELVIFHPVASVASYTVSGDVKLTDKPTWAY